MCRVQLHERRSDASLFDTGAKRTGRSSRVNLLRRDFFMETQAEYKVSSQQIDIDEVLKKINEIAKESATGDYIYRGEPAHHQEAPYNGRVTSGLYRQYIGIEAERFDVAVVQADILRAAHEYTPHKMEDFEILATLQHFGDKTNLIDFTTDYLVALFFACDGESEKPGRVILLQRQPKGDPKAYEVKKPPRTIRRAETQKSIFVQAPKGFVEPDRIVDIPAHLKVVLLDYLRNHHDISTKTIYNDLQGFIEKRGLHENAYTEFYKGVTSQNRADSANTEAERQEGYSDAITHYTAAIELNPENAGTYNNRGVAYRNTGDFAAAIADFDKAIELAPEDARVYNNRGVAYRNTGDFAAAIADFNKAIELNPEDAGAYNNRGNAYRNTGDFAAAIADFDKAIELAPEDARVYSNRGNAYRNIGDFAAAISDYNEAMELAPEDAGPYCNRGEAWLHLKEWEKAKADLTTAKDMEFDIIKSFQNDYESVEDFEAKNEVKIPRDIASLLQRTNPSSMSAKYQSYTQMLIDELREEHNFTRARVGQPRNWHSFSSGVKGISYRVKFARGDEVWTYVNIHDNVQSNRLDLFDALEQRKEEIESAFGSPLEWERLEKQRRSRIVVSRDGNIELPDDELEDIREWHIANLLKLKEVFQPKIKNALETLA
ncbi:hypothetical protein C6499_22850 [Candidatus Poribacteria bacterium]|nr:MAG: hypothetical protein C6499_22850 [Candidatus Poribacteria bacterium]